MADFKSEGVLHNRQQLMGRLAAKGLSRPAADEKAELFARSAAALRGAGHGGRDAAWRAFYVPGRIEVLGKHTDYAGGSSMVVAAERGFCMVVAPRDEPQITVVDAATGERICFELESDLAPPVGHWSNYPMTVARRVARNFPGARRGAEIAFDSDLPPAAGMSSSSAMIVAFFLALESVNELTAQPEYRANIQSLTDLAGYLGTVENGQTFGSLEGDRGVGTFGGSEDHTAILCGRPGRVSQYAYCPVRFERAIPLPADYTFAVGTSGLAAEKTGAAMERYNAASRLASELAEIWRRRTGRDDPHLAAVLASGAEAAGRLMSLVASARPDHADRDALLARLEHFVAENEQLLPAAGDALADGNLQTFGELVDQSQLAAEQLLGNQVPETVYLAAGARAAGAVAASAFGAGFGGSVWALVERAESERFLSAWAESYRDRFPRHARAAAFFFTDAGPAAFQVCPDTPS